MYVTKFDIFQHLKTVMKMFKKVKFVCAHLFMAFNISIVTRTDKAIVIGSGAEKTLQSTPLKSSPPPMHWRLEKRCINNKLSFFCGYFTSH